LRRAGIDQFYFFGDIPEPSQIGQRCAIMRSDVDELTSFDESPLDLLR
jgi:hypothetical protein